MATKPPPKRNLPCPKRLGAWLARPGAHGLALPAALIMDLSDRDLPNMESPMSLFCADAFVSPLEVEAAVTHALAEDLGRAGDITSIATVPEDTRGHAVVVARKAGVVSGLPLVADAFRRLSPQIEIAASARDGQPITAGAKLMSIEGDARAILGAERTALNF